MTIHDIYRVLGRSFRQTRHRWLTQQFGSCLSVLDIGGHFRFWADSDWKPARLALLNLEPFGKRLAPDAWHIEADALAIPVRDKSFELAMSNSVIEHVPDQARFAAEMMRVGMNLYCQTPSKWFPIEPHYVGLFVHWLPKNWFNHFIHRYLTVEGLVNRPDAAATAALKAEINLLSKADLQRLFPGCHIKTERLLGLPKSYIVWRKLERELLAAQKVGAGGGQT